MNELERQLDYPLADALPRIGSTLEVLPGIRWVRMGLPFALDHINLWLLRDRLDGRDGWTLVDCGIADDATRAAWQQVFASQLNGLPVLRVIVTHMHPDHIGLADWLTRRWSTPDHECRLWISATDFNTARLITSVDTGAGGDAAANFMASHGLSDPAAIEKIRVRSNHYASMVPAVPRRYRRLLDGAELSIGGQSWRCIAGYGHAPEHMSLHNEQLGVMISGDMVLPRISTNVSVIDLEPEADSLRLYLDSLERLRAVPGETLVLPSHGRPFRGLHTRIDQLQAHHAERLDAVVDACAEAPQTAASMLTLLFHRKLDLHQTTFAMGEAIAHLNLLWLAGRLERRLVDGVHRFSAPR
ncbi:MBL fold metallo-hydrolase [Piscinibacter sakaiensis]|uniref:MBL fold metallo-hydrolase n=1 Tax=Piscinibacter sakaiensis TaxID=1547922 RepID=UPI003AABC05D